MGKKTNKQTNNKQIKK